MSNDKTYDEALSLVVDEEPPYAFVPSAHELEQEVLNDPTFPWSEDTPAPADLEKRRKGPALSQQQQMQLCVWIVSGFKFKECVPWMLKEWGFAVTVRTWQYYHRARQDLLLDAAKFLDLQYGRHGYASPVVRYMKLSQHAQRLEQYMTQRGLYETETHVIGYGKNEKTTTSERFAKELSNEWRSTVKQLEEMRAKVEERLARSGQLREVTEITPELEARFELAAKWQPRIKAPADESEEA